MVYELSLSRILPKPEVRFNIRIFKKKAIELQRDHGINMHGLGLETLSVNASLHGPVCCLDSVGLKEERTHKRKYLRSNKTTIYATL